MGLVNWEWKNQNSSKFANTLWHFVAIITFIAIIQARSSVLQWGGMNNFTLFLLF
jgi:hypothetical protein